MRQTSGALFNSSGLEAWSSSSSDDSSSAVVLAEWLVTGESFSSDDFEFQRLGLL